MRERETGPGTGVRNISGLPLRDCLIAAITTPITAELKPDAPLLAARCRSLLEDGCDGFALFGTTGEGMHFAARDRMAALEGLLAAGLAPDSLIVATSALAIPEVVELSRHATSLGVAGCLLMPPCFFRAGIAEEGVFRWFAAVVDRTGQDGLRLVLYHFPQISGVPIMPAVIRRLRERYGPLIAGIKDSGGALGFTEALLRRFSDLAVFTGTETHVPAALAAGARGTICGLANVIPRLMRRMLEAPSLPERRGFVPLVMAVDAILSRGPFIPAVKAVVAATTGEPAWHRLAPPLAALPMFDEARLIDDFRRFEESLPIGLREPAVAARPVEEPASSVSRGSSG